MCAVNGETKRHGNENGMEMEMYFSYWKIFERKKASFTITSFFYSNIFLLCVFPYGKW